MIRLLELDLENFRGFARRQIIPLDADVVLISGPNGTGKTSLADAITWTLTGQLPGLARRLKGERKDDYVVNVYGSGPARVRLKMSANGETWEIERTGTSSTSELQVVTDRGTSGDPARDLARIFGFDEPGALANGVHAWGVLRQDSMRATLNDGSEALHQRLREILGLGALVEFETAAKEAAKQLAEQAGEARTQLNAIRSELSQARVRLEQARQEDAGRADRRQAAAKALDRLALERSDGLTVSLAHDGSSASLTPLGLQVGDLLRTLLDVTEQLAGVSQPEFVPTSEEMISLEAQAHSASERVRSLEAEHDAQLRVAEAAIEILGEHCPVCEQSINELEVRSRLQARLLRNPLEVASLAEARSTAAKAQQEAERAASGLRRARANEALRDRARSTWLKAIDEADLVLLPEEWRALGSLPAAQVALETLREELRQAYRLMAQVESDPATAALASRVQALEDDEREWLSVTEEAAVREQRGDTLRRAATQAAVEITEQSLSALEPAFAEVYDRLAPHPSFTHLQMFHEIYYGKGRSFPRIKDPVRNIDANPNLVCSEGQLNVVALSYFLALNLETDRTELPFAVLDDPLQAMDVINVLGFCDVARALRRQRQLILTTHDRRFSSLLERKLSPRAEGQATLHLRFSAWDPSGPRLEIERTGREIIPSLLRAA